MLPAHGHALPEGISKQTTSLHCWILCRYAASLGAETQPGQVARQGASGEARTGPHTASNRSNGHAPGRLRLKAQILRAGIRRPRELW